MKTLYQNLYNRIGQIIDPSIFSHFVAMKGSAYDLQKNRLMVIGRATNGWESLDCSSDKAFGEAAQKRFESTGFEWIKDCGNGFENGDGYYLNRSPFWRVIKKICMEMNLLTEEERWFESIVWSNIYKIAPKNSGEKGKSMNPNGALCFEQINECRDILRKEIEAYKPTHILFITGYDWWFCDGEGYYGVDQIFDECHKIDNKYVNGTARYVNGDIDVPVVIASRPERKNEGEYVDTVLKALNVEA